MLTRTCSEQCSAAGRSGGFYAESSGRNWVSLAHGARLVAPSLEHLARSVVWDMPQETRKNVELVYDGYILSGGRSRRASEQG